LANLLPPLRLPLADLTTDQLPPLELMQQAPPQPRRHGRSIPLAEPLEPFGESRVDRHREAQTGQEPLDPITVRGPLGLQPDQRAVQLPPILVVHRGHADDRPDMLLSAVPADEHRQQFVDVETIGLGAALTAIDLDRRGVDDEVVDPLVSEGAMEPEAVAAGLVAGDHCPELVIKPTVDDFF